MSTSRQNPLKMLLIASTGGHLAQLSRLAPNLGASDESLWITFKTPQSVSLLQGQRVLYVPYIQSRDLVGAGRAFLAIRRALKSENFELAVSTGAAVAVPALIAARLRKIPARYIESVSRVYGPSLSGRIIAALRIADLRTQHRSWANRRWRVQENVLGLYSVEPKARSERPRLFVTLGTIEGYRFDSLIDAVLATGLAGEDTVWQVGYTVREQLPGTVRTHLPADEFARFATEADVVISHAGVGTLLQLLDMGIYPVLITRKKSRGEHVDDHQSQIASLVNELGVGHACDSPEITKQALIDVSSRRVRPLGQA